MERTDQACKRTRIFGNRIAILPVLVLVMVAMACGQSANQLLVVHSDGSPVSEASGVAVRGYYGNSHRCNASFLGDGLFEFPDGYTIDNARITKDYMSSTPQEIGTQVSLVDFLVEVRSSDHAGGAAVNVNGGLKLYQGSSHRANFATPAADGMYHIDVVPGAEVCARVYKDYCADYTDTVDPALSDTADIIYQLVDFHVEVLASTQAGGEPVNVNGGLMLYQGSSHRANFVQATEPGQYHIDVVQDNEYRARIYKDYASDYTDVVDPEQSADADIIYQLVDFHVEVLASEQAGGEPVNVNGSLKLYQGSSHRADFVQATEPGQYHIDVVQDNEYRARIYKDYASDYTDVVDPELNADADIIYQLVDFHVEVLASEQAGGEPVNVNGSLKLYQGSSHRADFVQATEPGQYHIDVVQDNQFSARVYKDYASDYTDVVDPELSAEADIIYQLVDFHVEVLASPYAGGEPVNVNGSLKLYQGSSHRADFVQATEPGQYHIDVVQDNQFSARVYKDYASDYTDVVDPELSAEADIIYQLVDFHVEVLSSPYAGGEPVNVNGSLKLYQGSSHRADFVQATDPGQYHIDVVQDNEFRARVYKDYCSAYTETLDPALNAGADIVYQLADFCVDFATVNCDSVPVSHVKLYQGSSHRADFVIESPLREAHHDVLPGIEVRARVYMYYLSVYTETVVASEIEDAADVTLNAPTVYLHDDLLSGDSARLRRLGCSCATLQPIEPGYYEIMLLEGMDNLCFSIGHVYSPTFTVGTISAVLAQDDRFTVGQTAGDCVQEYDPSGTADACLADFNAYQSDAGEVTLQWSTYMESGILGFRIERNGELLDTLILAQSENWGAEYSWTDEEAPRGRNTYSLFEQDYSGNLSLLQTMAVVSSDMTASYELNGCYPNPFNPVTQLEFSLAEAGQVRVRVYSLTGQLVATLAKGEYSAGRHSVTFDGSRLASGVYVATLESAGGTKTMSMSLIK